MKLDDITKKSNDQVTNCTSLDGLSSLHECNKKIEHESQKEYIDIYNRAKNCIDIYSHANNHYLILDYKKSNYSDVITVSLLASFIVKV